VDNAGNLFIADAGNNRIRRVSPSGLIVTVAGTGTAGSSGDGGSAANAQLNLPSSVAVDGSGNLFIAEAGSYRIRKVTTNGIISTFAGNGKCCFSGDGGPATSAGLVPVNLATDSAGDLFVTDSIRIRRISPDGIVNTVLGSENGSGWLSGVAVDHAGNVFFSSGQTIRKISPDGTVTTVAGSPNGFGFSGDGGPATSARFLNPFAVAVDGSGNLFIADAANRRIRQVSRGGIITTVAGNGSAPAGNVQTGDGGPATSAYLQFPYAVATDNAGNVIIGDGNRIRRIATSGIITTLAGNGTSGFSGDGGPATDALLGTVTALALDGAGDLFFGDTGATGTRVRKISAGGIIGTVAGNGVSGFPGGLGDGGPATSAPLSFVGGLTVDTAGDLLIADSGDNRIRMVSPDGNIRTVAGGGTNYSDGVAATDAGLGCPRSIVLDPGGNLLIAGYCSGMVRKVSPAGIITTVAGNQQFSGVAGDGGPATSAEMPAPTGLALDSAGNLFISDTYIDDFGPQLCCDLRVRKIAPDGIITTVAGNGTQGYSGDGGPAGTAALNLPVGLTVDAAGNIYIADLFNNAIRVLRPSGRSLLIGAVVDAASQRADAISPGRIVVIYGAGLGPAHLVQNQPSGGVLGTTAGGTTVSFNGIAAPILYASSTQVAAVVPYRISGILAQVAVTYQDHVSNSFSIAVTTASPSFFTFNQQGWGQAAAINAKDGTVNTAANPTKVGDYVSLFATGEGQTMPGGVDGQLGGSTPPAPLLAVHVTVGGMPAAIQYAGGVPGQVAGLMQVNVRIPDGVQPGGYVPVVIQEGEAGSTPDVVWIAVSGN
jgi:uncharacterized protein (TIGR03437 family)